MNVNGNQVPIEVYQPEADGQIKQTTLEELKSWIADGKLQPSHNVRIKNLSWIEARNIPGLLALFEAKRNQSAAAAQQLFNPPSRDVSASAAAVAAAARQRTEAGIGKATAAATAVLPKISSFAAAQNPVESESQENPTRAATTAAATTAVAEICKPSAAFKAFEKKAEAKSRRGRQRKAAGEEKPVPHEPKLSAQTAPVSQTNNPAPAESSIENSDAESKRLKKCLLHRETNACFACGECANNFCGECLKTFDKKENCCPFCRIVCASLDEKAEETAAAAETTRTRNVKAQKKAVLLDLNKNSNFVIYDYPDERTRRLGIIPAFFIALLFSTAGSIFWVYKISPYLENDAAEISQNVAPKKPPTKPAAAEAGGGGGTNTATGARAADEDDVCMDPKTKQVFKCSEEPNAQLREALREHAKQVQSVQKAQKDVKEKTNLITSLFSAEAAEETAKAKQQNAPSPNAAAADEARAERDGLTLIKTFALSFLTIFGLLLLPRLFGKNSSPKPQ